MQTLDLRAGLLDVVPWPWGFAHSFALAWLLRQDSLRVRVLGAVEGFELPIDGAAADVVCERAAAGPGRADVLLTLALRDGGASQVAIETKVNDWVTARQIDGYRKRGQVPILYTPGLTGLMLSTGHHDFHTARLTGRAVATALEPVEESLPELIRGYVRTLAAEAERMDLALKVVQGEAPRESLGHGVAERLPPPDDLLDAAWVALMADRLDESYGRVEPRVTAHGRGIKWGAGGEFGPHAAPGCGSTSSSVCATTDETYGSRPTATATRLTGRPAPEGGRMAAIGSGVERPGARARPPSRGRMSRSVPWQR